MGTSLRSSFCRVRAFHGRGQLSSPVASAGLQTVGLHLREGDCSYNSYSQLSSLLLPPAFWLHVGSKKHAIKYEEMKINDTVHCTLQSAWQKECCLRRPSGPAENVPLPEKRLRPATVTQVFSIIYCCCKPNKLQRQPDKCPGYTQFTDL